MTVDTEKGAERPDRKQGGFRRVFKFRYDDIAVFLGMSKAACRKAAQRGKFDPGDLQSIFAFKTSRVSGDAKVSKSTDMYQIRLQVDVVGKRLRMALDGMERLKSELGPVLDADLNVAAVHELPIVKKSSALDAAV